jgi:hypothetical protein
MNMPNDDNSNDPFSAFEKESLLCTQLSSPEAIDIQHSSNQRSDEISQ